MLVANLLETELNALAKQELSPEQANAEFAKIITDYIKTAQVTVNVTGVGNMGAQVNGQGTGVGNMGAPVATVVTGNLS